MSDRLWELVKDHLQSPGPLKIFELDVYFDNQIMSSL